jgi:hypothetical protein
MTDKQKRVTEQLDEMITSVGAVQMAKTLNDCRLNDIIMRLTRNLDSYNTYLNKYQELIEGDNADNIDAVEFDHLTTKMEQIYDKFKGCIEEAYAIMTEIDL